ncbi:MAG: NADH-quinone oxidoreductase subunit NuoK [Pirellulales bacterium]|nr:NADH-quinone oxidoreductase subunit NuoK [Pirellulales bacterium]
MSELTLLQNYLVVGAILFGLGMVGFLSRRNVIVMFLSAELMLQGVSLSLVAWSRWHNDWGGQMMVIFIITVAACEAAIALALILMLYYRSGTLDIAHWQNLREDNLDVTIDQEIPENIRPAEKWPELTPAGIEPKPDYEDITYRPKV